MVLLWSCQVHSLPDTFVLDFGPPESWGNIFMLFLATQFFLLCYSSPREQTQLRARSWRQSLWSPPEMAVVPSTMYGWQLVLLRHYQEWPAPNRWPDSTTWLLEPHFHQCMCPDRLGLVQSDTTSVHVTFTNELILICLAGTLRVFKKHLMC